MAKTQINSRPTIYAEVSATRNADGTYNIICTLSFRDDATCNWDRLDYNKDTFYCLPIVCSIGDKSSTLQNGCIASNKDPVNGWYANKTLSKSTSINNVTKNDGTAVTIKLNGTPHTISFDFPAPPKYSVNINVIHPDGAENLDCLKFSLDANGKHWDNLTNEPQDFKVEEGQSITISNVQSLHSEMYTYSSGAGAYTINGDTTIEIKSIWTKHWVNINAYQPDNITEDAFLFDMIVYNRNGREHARWTNITNEPTDFTYEYGYTALIYNIRPNKIGIYFKNADGKGVAIKTEYGTTLHGVPKAYTFMFTNDVVVCLRSDWNQMKAKSGTWKPGDTYIRKNGRWERISNVYIRRNGHWDIIHG